MNSVNIVGRLTKDPDYSSGNTVFVRCNVAVQRRFKNKESGAYDSDFISVIAYGNTADFIHKYFHKGQRIGIMGEIRTGSYVNKEGQKVYTTDVLANSVEFVESSNNSVSEENVSRKSAATPTSDEDKLPF